MPTAKLNNMSLKQFMEKSRFWYPEVNKILYDKGKPIARYSGKTKKVTIFVGRKKLR